MGQYDNILKAVGGGSQLTTAQQSDNYSTFSEMMKQGVYLPDLLKRLDAMEKKLSEIEKPKENPIDAELFGVMEQAVKDDQAVVNAKRVLQNERSRVISELCVRDDGYRKAYDEYRRAVNAAYVAQKEPKGDS